MKTTVQISGDTQVLALLRSLPPQVVSKRGGPVRAALRKGAVVIHKQARANLLTATHNATASGRAESTGLLHKNLVVTRGKAPADGKGERYLVRVRRKAYPDRSGAVTTTLKTAQLLEYGSSQQPAEPWLRPAFEARAREAIAVAVASLDAAIAKIVAKLAKARAAASP